MKKFRPWLIAFVLAPLGGCVALGIVAGKELVSNPETLMLLKVLMYLMVALIVIGVVFLFLAGIILVIGRGLGFSQGDTRAALQAAIALARNSNTFGKLYSRIPRQLLPGASIPQYEQSPYYQYGQPFPGGGPVINGEASTPAGTEPATGDAWER